MVQMAGEKPTYKEVAKVPNFPAIENRVLQFWREIDAFRKLREKNAGNERWSFLDGPITANAPMGVHHAWGRSYKDMFQRYHAMNGKELRYQNGFDCQGLWVEVEVEKELGFAKKRDIATYGIDRFVQACKERVLTFAARQTAQSIRLGYWTDWDDPETLLKLRDALKSGAKSVTVTTPTGTEVTDHPEAIVARLGCPEFGGSYFTFSTENNYTIWTFLKKCHDQGALYRGTDVMPWCCRCGTGLSQMEVTEGRKIVSHTAVFVRFPLLEREKEALLVWTTTPWTLTSNVAAAVNPKMTYLKVRHGEWTYYLGKGNFEKERIQDLEAGGKRATHKLHTLKNILKGSGELEVLGELPGTELVGLRYQGPFDHLPAQGAKGGLTPFGPSEIDASAVECHRVLAWDEVSDAEGTGVVHIAPGCGAEDSRLAKEQGIVAVAPLTESGEYIDGFGEFSGRHVLDVGADIVTDLKTRGVLVAKESYPHVYPHCWRCKEELVFRLVDEWFIRMDWRERIKKIVPDIRWIPPDGEARELDWLKNMGDWMISKKRFWGLALPIWVCGDCDEFTVVGDETELKERAVEGWEEFDGHTPHRPWVDAVKLRCGSCGGLAERVEDVGNPWLDAGIVPFSTVHFNTDRDYWNNWFPADFVVECFPGQFRNWFYTLLAMSAMMDGRAPFKVLLGHALVRDAEGEEMHKSKGNSIFFDEAAEAFGAEVMRYLYASQNPTQSLNFPALPKAGSPNKGTIDGDVRRKLLTLWNCYSFFVTYAGVDGWKPAPVPLAQEKRAELDRWVLSRLQQLTAAAHRAFGDYAVYRFVESLEQFTDEFSNWYLRRSRRRFWRSETDDDKRSAYETLHTVLTTMTRLLAPILPFLAEEMYQNLVRSVDSSAPESVHLTAYPVVDEAFVDEALEAKIDAVIRTKNLGLNVRSQAKVKTRQPLSRLIVRPRDESDRLALQDPHFATQILEECNLKALELIDDEGQLITSSVKPNFKALGPRYGKFMKQIGAELARTEPAQLQAAFQEAGVYNFEVGGTTIELLPSDVKWQHKGPAHLAFIIDQGMFVALDTTITPELEQEGIARDFNRQVQELRKAADLEVSDRIHVRYAASERIAEAIKVHEVFLRTELLANSIELVDNVDVGTEVKAGGETLTASVEHV
jgi:isoleucyl-tRNA synthetase